MHDLPAGRFAVWATAWLSGRASYDDALDALAGQHAHRVAGLPGTDEATTGRGLSRFDHAEKTGAPGTTEMGQFRTWTRGCSG